jgi:hypothetical protein
MHYFSMFIHKFRPYMYIKARAVFFKFKDFYKFANNEHEVRVRNKLTLKK